MPKLAAITQLHAVNPAPTPQSLLDEAEARRAAGALKEAIDLCERAQALADQAADARMVALCQLALGNYHRYVPNALLAMQYLDRAESHLRSINDPALARALMFEGMVISDLGDQARALGFYQEALAVLEQFEQHPDLGLEATILGAIGVSRAQIGEFEVAEQAYLGAIERYRAAGIHSGLGYVYNNLANLRIRTIRALPQHASSTAKLGEELLAFVDEGLRLNQNAVGSMQMWALLLNTKGDGLRALGRPREALPVLELALSAYHEIQSTVGEAEVAADLGATMLDLGRYRDAVAQFEHGVEIAIRHKLRQHQRRLVKLLVDAHEHVGKFADAFVQLKRYHALDLELTREDAQKNLEQIALRGEIEAARQELREHTRRSAALSEQNQRLRLQTAMLEGFAYEDALTGLANRRKFDETVAALPALLPDSVSVAVLDLDLFKRINDTFSHAMGDAVLQTVGSILRSQCRGHDLVARIGGEEFAVLLRHITRDQASRTCERIRRAIEQHHWAALHPGLAVTVSIGVAGGNGETTAKDVVALADVRLYQAKNSGRNQVVDR